MGFFHLNNRPLPARPVPPLTPRKPEPADAEFTAAIASLQWGWTHSTQIGTRRRYNSQAWTQLMEVARRLPPLGSGQLRDEPHKLQTPEKGKRLRIISDEGIWHGEYPGMDGRVYKLSDGRYINEEDLVWEQEFAGVLEEWQDKQFNKL
jgi:hypothetical protein